MSGVDAFSRSDDLHARLLSTAGGWGQGRAWHLHPGPAAPLPGPNPLLLLCLPFPLGTTQPPTSRGEEEHEEGTSCLPPSPERSSICTSSRLAGGAGSRPRPLCSGYRPLPLPQDPAPPCGPLPSIHEPAKVPHDVLSVSSAFHRPEDGGMAPGPLTPSPASSATLSVLNPTLPGTVVKPMQSLLRAGQHWGPPAAGLKWGDISPQGFLWLQGWKGSALSSYQMSTR